MLISLEDAHVFYVSTFGRVDHLRQGMTGRYTGSYLDREKLGTIARPYLAPGRSDKAWLCWQSEANPSLPANLGNAGKICQIAGIGPFCPGRKPLYLNSCMDLSLIRGAGKAIIHSRDASCSAQGLER
jgi:hypothetical protein